MRNGITPRGNEINEVPNDLRIRYKSISPVKVTGASMAQTFMVFATISKNLKIGDNSTLRGN